MSDHQKSEDTTAGTTMCPPKVTITIDTENIVPTLYTAKSIQGTMTKNPETGDWSVVAKDDSEGSSLLEGTAWSRLRGGVIASLNVPLQADPSSLGGHVPTSDPGANEGFTRQGVFTVINLENDTEQHLDLVPSSDPKSSATSQIGVQQDLYSMFGSASSSLKLGGGWNGKAPSGEPVRINVYQYEGKAFLPATSTSKAGCRIPVLLNDGDDMVYLETSGAIAGQRNSTPISARSELGVDAFRRDPDLNNFQPMGLPSKSEAAALADSMSSSCFKLPGIRPFDDFSGTIPEEGPK